MRTPLDQPFVTTVRVEGGPERPIHLTTQAQPPDPIGYLAIGY